MGFIFTMEEKCRGCYACVRSCPAKAIKVKEGIARVIDERCVACGYCINICAVGAKQARSDIDVVWKLLEQSSPVIAILSSALPAAFPGIRPKQIVSALKALGFSEVMETAFGAELVCREYGRFLMENKARPVFSSACPAMVSFIEKFYPQLIDNLAPIVSPTIAMGRVVKWQYNPEAKVVFIGPCVAKKAESEDEMVKGVIDAVLTFAELNEMLMTKGINPLFEEDEELSGPRPSLGRLWPVPGGLLKIAGISADILSSDIVVAEGIDRAISCLREFVEGKTRTRFLDIFFCQGCIDGPAIDNKLSLFERRRLIVDYALEGVDPARTQSDVERYAGIDLSRKFTNRYTELPSPNEKEVSSILGQINKLKIEDQVNCGACGYNSCRELAIAVCQGVAEIEMCWPYLVERLQGTQEELIRIEKMTSLGQMAASIAHEINNPLAGVLMYTKLLAKKVTGDTFKKEESLDYLSKMESEVSRCSRIIRNLLDFARQTEPMLRLVEINQVIEQVLAMVGHQAQLQNVEIVKEFSPSLPKVMADFDQLQQVFTNLTLNAIQSMSEGGKLTLRTSAVDNQVKIEVEDMGCGIPKENLSKLGTPFFTTKEKGKGVGLGVAVVYGIVERHKGKVAVQSEVGKGTTFTVYLGAHDDEKG
ncbi:MAG TPA: 4Fe-4S dicluster domain-containing protein [Chloroflexi bacterium]|nr:4Fe-4S dicluster domain-containing protein [Chloroflexota bacterium]